MQITISKELQQACPNLVLPFLQTSVIIKKENDELWKIIDKTTTKIQTNFTTAEVTKRPAIAAARTAYKSVGKEPSRYRPSAEALMRRAVKGKGLYKINNIVDIINLVSLETGVSIGGYDADKIQGNIEMGIGEEKELYEAIGRGQLNIHRLPIFRDELGAFGSATSDSVRTMITDDTTNFIMIFVGYGNVEEVAVAIEKSKTLLVQFGQ